MDVLPDSHSSDLQGSQRECLAIPMETTRSDGLTISMRKPSGRMRQEKHSSLMTSDASHEQKAASSGIQLCSKFFAIEASKFLAPATAAGAAQIPNII